MKCKGCDAEIVFLRYRLPGPSGELIDGTTVQVPVRLPQVEVTLAGGKKVRAFINHFTDCPKEKDFTKKVAP